MSSLVERMLGRKVLLLGAMLVNIQCGLLTEKGAKLSFGNNKKIEKEVRELFKIVVNVNDIDNIKSSHDDLLVQLKVTNGENELYRSGYWKGGIDDGKAVFNLRIEEACKNCRAAANLMVRCGSEWSDGTRDLCKVDPPVTEISKKVVINESPYALQLEKLEGKNIKLTVTKHGNPLSDRKVYVSVRIPCIKWGWHAHYCITPRNGGVFSRPIELDSDGSWSTELDSDGSWEKEEGNGYQLDVCDAIVRVVIDNSILEEKFTDLNDCN